MGEVVQGNTAVDLNSSSETGILSPEQQAVAAGVEEGVEVPSKFKNEDGTLNQDALVKSYLALETKQGHQEPTPQPEEAEEVAEEVAQEGNPENEARDALAQRGINSDEITKDFYEAGETISEEWYDKLSDAGFPRELVNTYVKGLQAQNASAQTEGEALSQEIFAVAGDEATFKQMMDYYTANGGTTHADRYNAALQDSDISTLKAAVADMYVEYRAAEGVEPARQVRAADGGRNFGMYRSFAEMRTDMSNPLYRTDPAFRRDVEAKALRSKF